MIIPEQVKNTAKKTLTDVTDRMKSLINEAVKHMGGRHRRTYMAGTPGGKCPSGRTRVRVGAWNRSVVSTIKRRIDISKLIVNPSDYQVIFQTICG